MESPSLEVFNKSLDGTQCHGLVDEEMLGYRLDSMISRVFSNLVHAVVL